MPTTELFNGIAIIIDDEIGSSKEIDNLIDQIENRKMPCLKYNNLPDDLTIKNFNQISFILLDWNLPHKEFSDHILDGVHIPKKALGQSLIDANISFIKKMRDICFAPIFIFTETVGKVI